VKPAFLKYAAVVLPVDANSLEATIYDDGNAPNNYKHADVNPEQSSPTLWPNNGHEYERLAPDACPDLPPWYVWIFC